MTTTARKQKSSGVPRQVSPAGLLWLACGGGALVGIGGVLATLGGLGVLPFWGTACGVSAALVGGVSLWVAYRSSRGWVALRQIGAAVREFGRGTREAWSLVIPNETGPEHAAWNELCAEVERLTLAAIKGPETSGDENSGPTSNAAVVVEALASGVLVLDGDLIPTIYNAPARRMLGEPEELLGEAISGHEWLRELCDAVRVAVQSGVRTTLDLAHDASSSVLRAGVRPLDIGGVRRALVVLDDVSQQRMAQRAQTGFIAQATHELRTPLTNIRLYVEQAIEEGENDVELRSRALNVINQETRRLERLVSDMLSVSEIESGSLGIRCDEVRMGQFFEDLRRDFTAQAEDRGIALEFDLPPKLPVVWADRDKLSLAVQNVLGNALKYTPRDGSVRVAFAEEGAGIVLSISDTGYGIPSEDHERVFEKFARARDERISKIEGTGLGLPLAREVVRLHGGDITLESVAGEGSTFTLTFPDVALRDRVAA